MERVESQPAPPSGRRLETRPETKPRTKPRPKPETGLRRVFGLVSRTGGNNLVLSRSLTPLDAVLQSLSLHPDDEDAVFRTHKGIRPEEIKAARAYADRFGPDLRHPAPLPAGRKSLLLDENISYTLLPLASRLFGRSSHVEAEGLSRQNPRAGISTRDLDLQICRFAIDHEFAGILTCDSDFAHMVRHAGHPARQTRIFLIERGKDCPPVEKLVQDNAGLIRAAMQGPPKLTRL